MELPAITVIINRLNLSFLTLVKVRKLEKIYSTAAWHRIIVGDLEEDWRVDISDSVGKLAILREGTLVSALDVTWRTTPCWKGRADHSFSDFKPFLAGEFAPRKKEVCDDYDDNQSQNLGLTKFHCDHVVLMKEN